MEPWGDFISANAPDLIQRAIEHLVIVAQATVLASALGIGIGVAITRFTRLANPVIGAASVVLTFPAYALFGLLGVRLGYNDAPVIVGLTLYSLLPIVRNTYVGLRGVDPAVIEAAVGMGFSPAQVMLRVRLPIATPVILAGIRQAAVLNVAMATIGAAVASGGLGTPILGAIERSNLQLLIAGTVLVAVIGIVIDFALGLLERALRERYLRRIHLALVARAA